MSSDEIARDALMIEIGNAGREWSTATVLFHTTLAERFGLNLTDWKCAELVSREVMTAGQLANYTGLTTGAITGVIDRLEKARFVRRVPDPHDRRKVMIEALPDRDEEVARLFHPLLHKMAGLMAQYSDKELQLMLTFMRQSIELTIQAKEELHQQKT
jgi:DNA-binding MarR family transcriptional regulator